MEFAKGLAGIPGASPYWAAGKAVRTFSHQDDLVSVGGEFERPPVFESEKEAKPYTGLVSEMPSGSVGYTVPWMVRALREGEKVSYWVRGDR